MWRMSPPRQRNVKHVDNVALGRIATKPLQELKKRPGEQQEETEDCMPLKS
jgi:hypothetical protein